MADIDLTDRAGFGFWTTDKVRFSDQDGSGHVNNVAIAAYVETGRLDFIRQNVLPLRKAGDSMILGRLAIDYLAESHWPGEVEIGVRVLRIGSKSFSVGTGLFRDGTCIATAVQVLVNLKDGKSAPLGDGLRSRLEEMLP